MASKQIWGVNDTTGDAVAVATYYSRPFQGKNGRPLSVHVQVTGTPTGTFTLWYSNKLKPDTANDNDWVQDSGFAPTNPAAGTAKFFTPIGNLVAKHARLKLVTTLSSGTVLAFVETADGGS